MVYYLMSGLWYFGHKVLGLSFMVRVRVKVRVRVFISFSFLCLGFRI